MLAQGDLLAETEQEMVAQDAELIDTQQEMDDATLDIGRWHAALRALPTSLLGDACGARGREHPRY